MSRYTPALLLALLSTLSRADAETLCQPLALDCLPQVAERLEAREQRLHAELQGLGDELDALDQRLAHRAQLIDSNAQLLAQGRTLYQHLEDLPVGTLGSIRLLGQDYPDRTHLKAQLGQLFDEQTRLQAVQHQEQGVREQLALQQSQWRAHLQAIQTYQAELPQQRELLEHLETLRRESEALEQQRQRFEDSLGEVYSVIE